MCGFIFVLVETETMYNMEVSVLLPIMNMVF